jgi:hypothetical protein
MRLSNQGLAPFFSRCQAIFGGPPHGPALNRRMCLASYDPREIGHFQSIARRGQENIAQAQGLPWVILPTRISPEGATRYGENRLQTFEPDRVRVSSPFRAKHLFRLTQGKPWANLSCPFEAGPSGPMTGAKHIENAGLSPAAPAGHQSLQIAGLPVPNFGLAGEYSSLISLT